MAVKDFFDKVGDSAREAAENMAHGVNDVAKDVKHGIDEAADGVKQGVNEAADGIKKGANKAAQGIQQGVNQAVEGVKQGANQAGEGVKQGAKDIAQFVEEATIEAEKQLFHPVMLPHIRDYYYGRPIIVRIDRENKHRWRDAFKEAVGYDTNPMGELTVLNIYHDKIKETGVKLIPNDNDLLYYKHPFLPDTYISLETYFEYLKKASVSELERVGYDLGAKYIKIVFKENKKKNAEKKFNGKLNAHGKKEKDEKKQEGKDNFNDNKDADFEVIANINKINDSDFEVALDVDLDGNNHPIEPSLLFYKNDTDINTLIHMRLDPENKLNKKTYSFEQNKVFDISWEIAANIDLTLKKLKCNLNFSGNASFKSKAEEEERTILEYTIEF